MYDLFSASHARRTSSEIIIPTSSSSTDFSNWSSPWSLASTSSRGCSAPSASAVLASRFATHALTIRTFAAHSRIRSLGLILFVSKESLSLLLFRYTLYRILFSMMVNWSFRYSRLLLYGSSTASVVSRSSPPKLASTQITSSSPSTQPSSPLPSSSLPDKPSS